MRGDRICEVTAIHPPDDHVNALALLLIAHERRAACDESVHAPHMPSRLASPPICALLLTSFTRFSTPPIATAMSAVSRIHWLSPGDRRRGSRHNHAESELRARTIAPGIGSAPAAQRAESGGHCDSPTIRLHASGGPAVVRARRASPRSRQESMTVRRLSRRTRADHFWARRRCRKRLAALGSDIISFEHSSYVAVLEGAHRGAPGYVQFGAQDDPFVYETSRTSARCGVDGSLMVREVSELTDLRIDAFDATITYNYTGLATCAAPNAVADPCVYLNATSCAHVP